MTTIHRVTMNVALSSGVLRKIDVQMTDVWYAGNSHYYKFTVATSEDYLPKSIHAFVIGELRAIGFPSEVAQTACIKIYDPAPATTSFAPVQATHPPIWAVRLLEWSLPLERQDEVIGDLEQRYRDRALPRDGKKLADLWFWWMAIRAVGPLWWQFGTKRLMRWGIIAGLISAANWLWQKWSS